MAVTSCSLVNVKASEDKDGYSTYVQKWQVLTDSRGDGPKTVKAYPGLPARGSNYAIPSGEADEYCAFTGRTVDLASEDDTLKKWLVVVTFSNKPDEGSKKDPEQSPGDPVDDPPQISTYAVKEKEPFLKDLNGDMIASSAGEPYDPVQERDATRYMLRIVRNVADVDPAFWAGYRDAINSDVFFGCAPETVKVETPGTFEVLYAGGRKYYKVTWEFSLRSGEDISDPGAAIAELDNWRLKLYDYGMYKLVGDAPNQTLVALKDLSGNTLTAPRLLDGEGGVLPIGQPPKLLGFPIGLPIYRTLPFGLLFPGMPQII